MLRRGWTREPVFVRMRRVRLGGRRLGRDSLFRMCPDYFLVRLRGTHKIWARDKTGSYWCLKSKV